MLTCAILNSSHEDLDPEAINISCATFLGILATTATMSAGSDEAVSILQFLVLHSLFKLKAPDDTVRHVGQVLKPCCFLNCDEHMQCRSEGFVLSSPFSVIAFLQSQ